MQETGWGKPPKKGVAKDKVKLSCLLPPQEPRLLAAESGRWIFFREIRLAETTRRAPGWAMLFGVLAAANLVRLFAGTGGVLAPSLMAVGFAAFALAALYRPSGFLTVSWRQLQSPRNLGAAKLAGVAGAILLVAATAIQAVAMVLQGNG